MKMKYLIMLVFAALALNVHVEAGKYTAIIKSMATSCKNQENASDQDVDELANGKAPESKEGKCLSACMGQQFGIIVDNKLSKEGFLTKVNFVLTSDSDKKKAEEVADECKEETDSDRCEAAFKIWKCVDKGTEARDLNLFKGHN